ncbi:peptide-methionine (S)-S-oxide reductase MsrA [Novosphingobium lentum]|uniref:peptide-methionine (S)-S-oxide reductase MsrA n=1 Tax=Novosphingobium lentum TaxID=145287 RepID=UPI00082FCFD6|nr:peptide-methionine (S)-S-oxide reductase MsrA [Novosphingobium lentum]
MRAAAAFSIVVAGMAAACQQPAFAEGAVATPAAAVEAHEAPGLKTAIFAGGCFWGIEAVFSHVKGVTSAVSGYEGGARDTAQYERVSDGDTGHAESVRIIYDPAVVRYDQLLRIFFAVGTDPTQLNRQGPDTGTQYRNALVPLNVEQSRVAAGYLAQLKALNLWHRPIVTAVEPNRGFFPAEAHHQDFALHNPDHPYIQQWDAPKVAALHRLFPAQWKPAFTPG